MRPSIKQTHIESDLRRMILDSVFPPGSRLPTQTEIEQRFQASNFTVQRALDRLASDGFIQTRGKQGTYVAERPPHLSRYGLVFPSAPTRPSWARFWTALANEAIGIQQAKRVTIPVYHNIDGHADSDDHQRLLADVRGERLAGLIFATHPFEIADSPIVTQPGVPRVAVMPGACMPGIAAVDLDSESFIDKALDYFAGRRRKHFAMVSMHPAASPYHAHLIAGLQARGMKTHSHWLHRLNVHSGEGVNSLVQLLMHRGQQQRPDALLIADDNLVEHATAGLLAAGVKVPDEIDVVAHCNFPWPAASVMPCRRLGYDARQLLATCMDSIDRQRRGEAVPALTDLRALFEDELVR